MSKKKRHNKTPEAPPAQLEKASPRGWIFIVATAVCVAIATAYWLASKHGSTPSRVSNPTFSADIAPLIYANCAHCHHQGGSAPFALIAYADVSKHAEQIAKATQSRYMPPRLPPHGPGAFDG